MVPDGRTEWTDGRRQNYIPPTSSGDNNHSGILLECSQTAWIQIEAELSIKCLQKLSSHKVNLWSHGTHRNVTPDPDRICLIFCLFDLILYVPSTIFQLYSDGLPGLNQY